MIELVRKGIRGVAAVFLEDFIVVDKARPRLEGDIVDNTQMVSARLGATERPATS